MVYYKRIIIEGGVIMKSFNYVIKDEIGIHARPAGLLVKEAKQYASKTTLIKDGKSADLTKLMAIMSLGVKCGDTITVQVEGDDEETAASALEEFFTKEL
jgi:phosphocarrier protein